MHTVVSTKAFLRQADELGIEELERFEIVSMLAENPTAGVLIQGTGGVRKLRFAGKGKGKSGGYRVITFYASESIPVFLLSVYAKGTKVDLTKAERNELAKRTARLAETYSKKVVTLASRRKEP